ncbi:MAG: hypothetical protein IB618_00560 [Candidatus Pacearchaeota archaeon]|nr:MAG: hypothetical protein IB618_00560 [Candidatus Pacearchaeota archaeon]
MTLKEVVEQRKRELKKMIMKTPKDEGRLSLMVTCRSCLVFGFVSNERAYKHFVMARPYLKEMCKAAYDVGALFGPLEKDYAGEQLINKWLAKEIDNYHEPKKSCKSRKKFLGLF